MPPPSGFDYSKWDKLELSDDEDDHPGAKFIEENTLRRIKRETHGRQEQERGEKIEALTKTMEEGTKQLDVANGDGGSGSLSHAEKRAIEKTIEDAKLDLQKKQRERKFNADEMCYVSSERTLVGDACKPDTGNGDLDYEGFVTKHKAELETLAASSFREKGLEDMGDFFKHNVHLLTEHSMGFMLLKCLHLEMAGDRRGMLRTAKTGYALKSIMDFADAGKKQMKDAGRPFFTRLAEDDKVFKDYTDAYDDYCEKLKERAVVKKTEEATAKEKLAKEIDDAESLEEIPREQRLGPGGLDPVEVFESLPKEMQDAFESGNVDTLRDFVNKLPMNEAKLYMKRMVDSGLWVATPGQEGTALQDGDDDEDE